MLRKPASVLAIALLAAAPTLEGGIIKDNVRVSVKYILDSRGIRPPGVYSVETSVITAFSDMNIVLDRMDIRWRLLPVEVVEVSGGHQFFDVTDATFDLFERTARDIDPARFQWRDDAINIYLVRSIEGAGGRSSFPGNTNHRDIVVVKTDLFGEIKNHSGGWLHEIGHYLSLLHTFECFSGSCDSGTCRGQGASHLGWRAECADVCPHENNIMSYDEIGAWGAEVSQQGKFTECQISHMDFELYDPRGSRNHVLQPCSESCRELVAPCREACEGTEFACLGSCNAVWAICDGGCGTVGGACRETCNATGATCRGACGVTVDTCYAGCDAVCFFDDESEACQDCRSACASIYNGCAAPCNGAENDCLTGCPTSQDCFRTCHQEWSNCAGACAELRAACMVPCDSLYEDCAGDCDPPPARPTNLARRAGVTATQTSDHAPGFEASRAIDGNLDTFSSTRAGWAPTILEVDLAEEFEIETVVVRNRRDCCRSRLRDIVLIIGDAQGRAVYKSPALNTENAYGYQSLHGPERLVFHLPELKDAKVRGRFVRIERLPDRDLSGSGGQGNSDEADVLSIAEIGIYGNAPPPPPDVNIVRQNNNGGPVVQVRQSSTGYGGVAERAIDGVRDGSFWASSVTHTDDADTAPWWEVDLGQDYPIGKVVLWNRTDCCAERLHNFRVSLLSGLGATVLASVHFPDGSFPDASGGQGYAIGFGGREGRTIRIDHLGDRNGSGLALSLAEVEVFTGPAGVLFVRGDADSSGAIDLTDAVTTLGYLFLGGAPPACLAAADADGDGDLSLTDAVRTLSWLFTGGRPPEAPAPRSASYGRADCGADATAGGELDCARPGPACI